MPVTILLTLANACKRLREIHGVEVSHDQLLAAVLDGSVPALNTDWRIDAKDLPSIAQRFAPAVNHDTTTPENE